MERNKMLFLKLQAFTWQQMTDAMNLFKTLKKEKITEGEFFKAINAEIEARKKQIKEDEARAKAAYGKLAKPPKRKKSPEPPVKEKKYTETLTCPECGETAYAQSVCPSCSKGKAGIKRQYICGDCNFAFYLD